MHSIAFWPVITLIAIATAVDLRSGRIPNWLVLPFLGGGILMSWVSFGGQGLMRSMEGVALATVVTGLLCWLRGMGMGDLKLCAAVGAWIGPAQLTTALVVTGLAGGVLALAWAAWHGSLSKALDGSGDLIAGFGANGIRPHPTLVLTNSAAGTMPYAPAIAVGTLFSFFAT